MNKKVLVTGSTKGIGQGLLKKFHDENWDVCVSGRDNQLVEKLTYRLNEVREKQEIANRDFMTVGGMGHASAIALGIAIQRPDTTVVCLDGDGAALMHLGAMAMVGELKPLNFVHILCICLLV